jgi:hypothetical protein
MPKQSLTKRTMVRIYNKTVVYPSYSPDVFIAEQEGKAVRRAGSQPAVT